MATQADVRRIALSLPAAEEASERFAFSVPNKSKLKEIMLANEQLMSAWPSGRRSTRQRRQAATMRRE